MAFTKFSSQELDLPGLGGVSLPSWKWLDDMFHDNEWRQSFKIEECTEGDSMIVRAELPGVDPDKDIKVEIVEGTLVISAEKSETHEKNDRHSHRSEFHYGSLMRSVPLPKGVDESSIVATYKDGVLEVRMAVPAMSSGDQAHRIEIKRA
jgi:HSP20 family protein